MSTEEGPKPAVTGLVVSSGDETPMSEQKKQGSKCCVCCCDYRRATIVVAIIQIIVCSFYWFLSARNLTLFATTDANVNPVDQNNMPVGFGALAIMWAISDIIFINQLVAAITFSKCWSAVALFGNIVVFAFSFFYAYVVYLSLGDPALNVYFWISITANIILSVTWAYPLIGFIHEMNKGIMSKETYPREAYCCL